MQQSFLQGFVKRASEHGYSQAEAAEVLKLAYDPDDDKEYRQSNSGMGGRYLDMKALRSQTVIEHPFKHGLGLAKGYALPMLAGGLLGGLGGSFTDSGDGNHTHAVAGALSGLTGGRILAVLSGNPEAESAIATQGGTKEDRQAELDKTDKKLLQRSTLGNMTHSAKQMAMLTALLGGAAGGVVGHNTGADHGALIGALSGVAGGGFAGAGIGGLVGGLNSLVHKNTSPETHGRSKQMLAKHPRLTAIPFGGDIVGAHDA